VGAELIPIPMTEKNHGLLESFLFHRGMRIKAKFQLFVQGCYFFSSLYLFLLLANCLASTGEKKLAGIALREPRFFI
jgi:hypothetical protein